MKSSVVKHSIMLGGHKTSVSLEETFWTELKEIAHFQRVTLSKLVAGIDGARTQSNLSSAIRVFVLEHFQNEVSHRSAVTKANQLPRQVSR